MNVVGIDLGTSMSVIARLDPTGAPVTIANSLGDPRTPSVVYYDDKNRKAVVGQTAKRRAPNEPERVASFVKREIGSKTYSRTVDGRTFRPETLSAIVLRKLKQDAERKIGPISKVVITVPAYFDHGRRMATQDAGRIAGLEVVDIINEPTAAALSYAALQAQHAEGARKQLLDVPGGQMTALVYDLGGGTFDVTLVDLRARRFRTLATDGEAELGGKDWDERIAAYLVGQFVQQFGFDPTQTDARLREKLQVLVEDAKIQLSDFDQAELEFGHGQQVLRRVLTRDEFEHMSAGLLESTRMTTENLIEKAELGWEKIDRILLVGGATKMPMVKKLLGTMSGKVPDDSLDADQVVAQGAAIYSGICAAKDDDCELMLPESVIEELRQIEPMIHRNAHSLGVAAYYGDVKKNFHLIPKNTELPAAMSQVFYTHRSGKASLHVQVLEGEAEEPEHNIQVGECRITGLPPELPQGSPVQVRLAYDGSGRITVMALDMTYGRFAQAVIENHNRLTKEQIEREKQFVDSLEIQ
jgi:molecular chaperone DnaK